MKRSVMTAAFVVATALGAVAADQTWTGTISDKMCGTNHKAMDSKLSERDCTLACTKEGTSYALVSAGKIYQLSGHDADLKTHAGHSVKVTGEMKGDTIRVSKVEMSKP
jgi:opacity protein-like surface antigen